MGAILKLLSGVVSLFNRFFSNQRDNELRKDGARKADIAQRDKIDKVQKDAKKFRKKPKPGTKSGAAERLRRYPGRGG